MWGYFTFLRAAFRNTPKWWWILSFGIWGFLAYVSINDLSLHSVAAHWQLLMISGLLLIAAIVLLFFGVVGGAFRTLRLKEKSYRAQIKELESRLSQLSAMLNTENKVYPDRGQILQDNVSSLIGDSLLNASMRMLGGKVGIPTADVVSRIAGLLKTARK